MVHFHHIHQVIRAVSDGTGLSAEEVWLTAASTAIAAGMVGLVRATEFVTRVRAELNRPGR